MCCFVLSCLAVYCSDLNCVVLYQVVLRLYCMHVRVHSCKCLCVHRHARGMNLCIVCCMKMCTCVDIHMHTYVRTYIRTYLYVHAHIHTYVHRYIHTCIYTYISADMHVCMHGLQASMLDVMVSIKGHSSLIGGGNVQILVGSSEACMLP